MSEIKPELRYTKEHEWVKIESDSKVLIGITDFAQSSLGDVTFLELPSEGDILKSGAIFGTVESVKSVSDLYAPLSGKITKLNSALIDDPAPINTSPYADGWLLEIEISDPSELENLLSPEQYEEVAE